MADVVEFSSVDSLLEQLKENRLKKITEISLHDKAFSKDKRAIKQFFVQLQDISPDIFVNIVVQPSVIDRELASLFAQSYCSIDIPLNGTEKNDVLLFDKKLYSAKVSILNEFCVVFGFDMGFGSQNADTFKAFRERLDFAVSLYPNHIDFFQIETENLPKSTGVFSSKDLDFARGIAFACKTFYSSGRAVAWFNAALAPLKISASTFFADFEEWQHCNNCSWESGFSPDSVLHFALEEMQLKFLQEKYAEKHKESLFLALSDIVRLNGAFSRVAQEGKECTLNLSYNPSDLLSPQMLNLTRFCDTVTMQECSVKVFCGSDSPDYKILEI